VAIAGGVNLYLHPSKYQSLCQRQMLSHDGKCHSYGAGADGFVPGEGVGTLVLKPLSMAKEHGDHIYAVIAASAFDHSGRSNGYTSPNPNSLANLIGSTLSKAHFHPETIGWVEGHGTGTQLGDSIEIAAMTQVFQSRSAKKQYCPIGSVKSNIGHSESAAGIAGIAKVIAQLKHRQLIPSIHSERENPNIEFRNSPFYLQHELSEWKSSPDHRRRALINSFGAGGVNACVLIEEYEEQAAPPRFPESIPALFVLSARNEDRLREYVDRFLTYLRSGPGVNLADLCYTLQVGRETMEARLALVVSGVDELIGRLDEWSLKASAADVYHGYVRPQSKGVKIAETAGLSLASIGAMWVAGNDADWSALYPEATPRRIPLPAYPFARDRYWISSASVREKQTLPVAQLHPLISYNSSTLREMSFTSCLSDKAFYAIDHKVNEEGIFPGTGFLEMACIAGSIAAEHRIRRITDIVWSRPLSFRSGSQTVRTSLKYAGESVVYTVSSLDEDSETVLHSEGRLAFNSNWTTPADAEYSLAIEKLKTQCSKREEGDEYYSRLSRLGLNYGPSFRCIREIYIGDSFALAKLRIPEGLKADFEQFILHPSIMDGALQTVGALAGGPESLTPHLPFALDAIDILHPLRHTCYAYVEFSGSREPNRSGVRKFNIRLLNESGDVLIGFRNLFARPISIAALVPCPEESDALPDSGVHLALGNERLIVG
jgi:acyl transferase domain-containing protein